MSDMLFPLPPSLTIPVSNRTGSYPIGRIFCVGRNYAAHAAEMGFEVDREAPFYFTKSPASAILTGATYPYPPGTENYHHEMEMALAIGAPVFKCGVDEGWSAIFAYGCALDMTRRDLQIRNREKGRPWDLGKDVEGSAVFAPLTVAEEVGEIGPQRIHLSVNGEMRQDATLAELIWSPGEIVSDLSHYYHLRPGDLILSGTPAGVGPVKPGDQLVGGIDGMAPIALNIADPE